jgi:hypothetical protein
MQAIDTDKQSTEDVGTDVKAVAQSKSLVLSPKPPTAAYIFGSPAQKPHVFEAPTPVVQADNDAISKQLEEMQRRLAGSSTNLAGILKASAAGSRPVLARGSVSEKLLPTAANQKSGGVRFEESHDKHFSKSVAGDLLYKQNADLCRAGWTVLRITMLQSERPFHLRPTSESRPQKSPLLLFPGRLPRLESSAFRALLHRALLLQSTSKVDLHLLFHLVLP